ncbi:MAG: hypothetical protein IBX66_11705 [Lutibacter sp.]|nr:hypothetical protein [Lutibacter sp.]
METKKTLIICCFALLSLSAFAQEASDATSKKIEFGTEIQAYPVGYITTITSNIFIKENLAIRLRVGGNFADREDFSGRNDDEKAHGFGGSVGLVKYFPYRRGNFIAGAHIDGWNMWTDWKDGLKTDNPTKGTTYNFVVQPWVNGGYLYDVSKKLNVGLTAGFGREINVITSGEKVGEGWMGSLSLIANFSFK